MEVFFLVLFLGMGVMIIGFVFIVQGSRKPHEKGRLALKASGEAKDLYNLAFAVVDPDSRMIGLRPASKQVVARTRDGTFVELTYKALRSVSLTPVLCTFSESSGQTTTRRGSQIIGASLGGVVAGPLGMVVGGLSGGQTHQSITTTNSSTGDLELEVFFRDDQLPRFAMHAGTPDGAGGSIMNPDLGEAFKDMAARLANIIDAQRH